jgi:hypothetical protein
MSMSNWKVTGWQMGKGEVTVTIQAKDHNQAVLTASKRKGLLLVVRSCVLIDG